MERAVELGKKSIAEPGRDRPAPKVGVVIAKDGESLVEVYRGEDGDGHHAEYIALERLADADLRGATVYTTLEPCAARNHPKIPCAQRLVERGVGTVYIGAFDPDPAIYRRGWEMLDRADVALKDFHRDLREEIERDSAEFFNAFRLKQADRGEARFDWNQNGGAFLVRTSKGDFNTRWTGRGADAIYAVDNPNNVVLAKGARDFASIDDPSAFRFDNHTVPVRVGEIAVFRQANEAAYLLVRLKSVRAGPERGHDFHEAVIEFELRVLP
jgi:diaminohydroxyphosphoribosylaminopyrimidine deaminase/5-amino-6-(5-phosphoribosylamino)uracil reductase